VRVGGEKAKARLCFVTPRYGDGVVGGSELLMAEASRGLAGRGYEVEILTTCARDHYTWANDFPEESFEDRGVTVRRFETRRPKSSSRFAALDAKLRERQLLTPGEELAWVSGRFEVPGVYRWLRENGRGYDAIVFSPYLFWTTLHGAAVHPERTILMPCLHDEPAARLRVVSSMLGEAASVWFLSEPEHQLGHRVANIRPGHSVVGAAVEPPASYDPDGFRERHRLERPFLLYAGRREDGKGWRSLVTGFGAAVLRHDLPFDLVTVGVGVPYVPGEIAERVIDLGYLAPDELPDAFAAASAYLQPSPNESFSRTIMESWLAGTIVIATSASEVLTWHCERSGGGLTYGDPFELAQCLAFVAESPEGAQRLAGLGREYVLEHYRWPMVLDAMQASIENLVESR
jgi:glycosyltransferase involved in cell wall biosynthesis